MRIVILSREYPPLVLGGQGTFVKLIARTLANRGHQITLIIPRQDGSIEVPEGVEVHQVPLIGKSFITRVPSFFIASMPKINSVIKNADIVYAHGSLVWSLKNTPVLTHLHSSRLQLARASFRSKKFFHAVVNALFYIYDWLLVAQSDAIITPNTMNLRLASNSSSKLGKTIYQVPNGIDIKVILKLRRKFATEKTYLFDEFRPMRVLYYGRVDASKGLDTLIRAILLATHINVTLTIMGEGPLKQRLEQQAALMAKQITFVDAKEYEKALRFASDFDLVILPSLFESFGMVTIESMALGVPVLTSDACPEFGQPTFKAGDERSLIEAMSDVYHNYRVHLARAASLQKSVAKYDIGQTADKIIELMHEIVESHRS